MNIFIFFLVSVVETTTQKGKPMRADLALKVEELLDETPIYVHDGVSTGDYKKRKDRK